MNAPLQAPAPADTGRRSKQVALVLLGTLGVVGGAVAWDAWQRAGQNPDAAATQPEAAPVPIAADRTYRNNDYIPGVGYYHSPYHSWFPFPYNHYDASRGYFAGGLWQAVPFAAGVLSSRPNNDGVAAALAAQRRDQEQRARTGSGGVARPGGSWFGGSSFLPRPTGSPAPSARPAASPSPAKPSIQRGGFGSSGHSGGGAGS